MSTHQLRSPSRLHRDLNCPGAAREEAKYPVSPSGPASIDGTHSHTLLECCIKAGLSDPTTDNSIGKEFSDHEGKFVVDAERAQRVKVAIDYIRERSLNGTFQVTAEERVDPAWYFHRNDMAGTCDVQIQRPDELEVIDYKDGMNPVSAKDNEQMTAYAFGALAKSNLAVNQPHPFKFITMTIIQPKLALKGQPAITSHTMTVEELLGKLGEWAVKLQATDDPDAPLVPGDKQCRYCRAKGCSARASQALAAAGVTFQPIEVKESPMESAVLDVTQQVAVQEPTELSNERLVQILEAAPLLRQTIEQAEAEAQRRMEAGQDIPGLKLVYSRGSQAWNLPDEEIAEKLKGMGVPKDAVFNTSVVSPAQAKKLTWENRKGEQKTLSERQLKTLETEYISKLAGKLTVAPASDPRPAVVRNAAPLFSAVQEQPAVAAVPEWLAMPAWMQPQ